MKMEFEEWAEKYLPMEWDEDQNGNLSIYLDIDAEHSGHVLLARKENRLWTRIEEDDEMFIVPGKQFVNRHNYIITEKPYESDEMLVFYEEERTFTITGFRLD